MLTEWSARTTELYSFALAIVCFAGAVWFASDAAWEPLEWLLTAGFAAAAAVLGLINLKVGFEARDRRTRRRSA